MLPQRIWLEYQLSPHHSDVCSLLLQPPGAQLDQHLREDNRTTVRRTITKEAKFGVRSLHKNCKDISELLNMLFSISECMSESRLI